MPTYIPVPPPKDELIIESMQEDIDKMKTIKDKLEFAKRAIYSANTVFDISVVSEEESKRYKTTVLTMAETGMEKEVEGE
jgi:hypothetical protein